MPDIIRWEGSLNARFALPGLIRSANLSFLSPQGRAALLRAGISRILDLRNRSERQIDPAPFASRPEYLNLPLLPYRDRAMNAASATARSNADVYRTYLDHAGNQIASIFGAMHDAPPGLLLVHCHAGKDRTGLVAALAQDLCGLPREQIMAEYAESDEHLGSSTPRCSNASPTRRSGQGWRRFWSAVRKTSWRPWSIWTVSGAEPRAIWKFLA